MKIITLTTDFGLKDYSVAALKGRIYSKTENVTIVDYSHHISLNNLVQASYVVKNASINFPKGTVNIIGVDAELNAQGRHVIFQSNNQYFICADTKLVSLIASEASGFSIYELPRNDGFFPTLNIFIDVACKLVDGAPIETLGTLIEDYELVHLLLPRFDENRIDAKVLYVDHYENVVTNLNKELFERIGNGRKYKILLKGNVFSQISKKYKSDTELNNYNSDELSGLATLVFNSNNMLEVAIRNSDLNSGGTSSLLGVNYGDSLVVKFY